MRLTSCLVLSLATAYGSAALASADWRLATILPEMKKYISNGHKYLDNGAWEFANANADLVLISDEVSVSVNVDGVSAAQRQSCLRALDAALTEWENQLDGTVHFRMENDPSKADVKVVFRPDVRLNREAVAGVTNWKRSLRYTGSHVTERVAKADMQIRARDLRFKPMTYEAMRQAVEHEFGHVLGLEDSVHVGDLMGELDMERPVSAPREYEVQAVRDLRNEAKQIKAAAKRNLN